jgi:NhaP-type Na+/H+ or K+/H+ antiporter
MAILILAIFVAGFCMIAKRLSATIVTAPMVFLAFGFLMSETGMLDHEVAEKGLHIVAELALIVLLFLDAAQINLKALFKEHPWPMRMLLIGLPLSMVLGTFAAWVFMPGWPIFALALIAAILAPTDAALGQAVVTNPVVPGRVRRAITVESGLNDGLALPAILLFASLTAQTMEQDGTQWLIFGAKQLLLGPLAGVTIGLMGGAVLMYAKSRKWTAASYEGIGALALAGVAYLGATAIGGNGFISAFVAGLAFGGVVKGQCKFVYEFTESEGQILAWGAFFLLGLALVPEALHHLSWPMLAIILTSLFVIRPLAIWISLIGSGAMPMTRIFFGWFGPRGLATALFALLVVKDIGFAYSDTVLYLAVNAVWISALLHGITALPAAKAYAQKCREMGECEETREIQTSAKPLKTSQN